VRADGKLIRRAARGNQAAFEVLWLEHREPVYRFAAWMLDDRDAAEDVTQETFLAVIRAPDRYDSATGSLRTYLFSIARNLSRKRLRQLRPSVDLDVEEQACESDVLLSLISAETSEVVRSAVEALPPLQREVLFLFEYESMSMAEAATVLATDVNIVKQRLWRARQNLKRDLSWMKM
jgi:RNA polymerase sigma-70 factor (ECF subfamily)